MKDFVKKIALSAILILLPFFVYGEDRPEENSILRLSSVNFEGKTVYAVAMDDGSVKALTSDDAGYKLENSLWLVKHEPGNYIFQEFFTFQNIGTGKYLSFAIRSGVNGSVLLYLTTSNQSINLQSGSYGYYYENLVNPDDYVGDMLYIRYDPYYNEWRFYETLDDNKTESQNKAKESGMAWDDNTHPESNEKSSMEIPGSEVGEMLGSGNLSFGDILANLDKITDKIEYNDALESTASSIVVVSDATYPKS